MVDDVIVDDAGLGGDLSQLEKEIAQAAQARNTTQKPAKKPEEKPADDSKLPTKLRGKTPEEIAEMYANLESAYGRMANDLGTQRKLTDRLLDLKRHDDLQTNGATKKVEIKSSELLENPTEALERFTQAREAQNESRLQEMEQRLAESKFVAQHPDYQSIAADPNFAAWVQGSPIRLRAAQAAHAGAWDVASDLLNEYKAQCQAAKPDDEDTETEEKARAAAAKAALESGAQGGSSTSKKSGKVYRRADLMRLRAERPEVYMSDEFQREILLAYNEGRVK